MHIFLFQNYVIYNSLSNRMSSYTTNAREYVRSFSVKIENLMYNTEKPMIKIKPLKNCLLLPAVDTVCIFYNSHLELHSKHSNILKNIEIKEVRF